MSLPPSLKSRYYIDGYYAPVKIFSNEEITKIYKDYQKYVNKFGNNGVLEGDYRFRVHLLAKWAHEIVTHPLLVSAVRTVLDSPNILCWSTDLNIKPGPSRGHLAWHQDCAYSGLEPSDNVVTAWVALTSSSEDNGGVEFWPGSAAAGQLQHRTGDNDPDNLLVLKQFIPDSELTQLDGDGGVITKMSPGEVSLHSWKCVHRSGPNKSDKERVGLAIRYMTSDVQNIKAVVKERATLICGSGGVWWDLETGPKKDYGDKEIESHKESMEREKKNYLDGSDSQEYK